MTLEVRTGGFGGRSLSRLSRENLQNGTDEEGVWREVGGE